MIWYRKNALAKKIDSSASLTINDSAPKKYDPAVKNDLAQPINDLAPKKKKIIWARKKTDLALTINDSPPKKMIGHQKKNYSAVKNDLAPRKKIWH